jgi:serine phosphatase RsbU (regulator of sigma subunit)
MFGKDRLRDVLSANVNKSAGDIQNAVVTAVRQFQPSAPQKDDITLVVIKAV